MALQLIASVIGPADTNRLLRELNSLDDFLISAAARKAGTSMTPPKTTQLLEELAKANKLNLLEAKDRTKLAKQLTDVAAQSPKLQLSFAVEPPPKVVETILTWLRQNIHPSILLQIGLQPNIGAGCVLRTANREFDLSMRQHLLDSRSYLAELIEGAVKRSQPAADRVAPPTPQTLPPAATGAA